MNAVLKSVSRKSKAINCVSTNQAAPETSALSPLESADVRLSPIRLMQTSSPFSSDPAILQLPPKLIVQDSDTLIQTSDCLSINANRRMLASDVLNPLDEVSDRPNPATHAVIVPDFVIPAIREVHRRRCDLINAEGNLKRQIKAITRRIVSAHMREHGVSDDEINAVVTAMSKVPAEVEKVVTIATIPLQVALDALHPHKLQAEKELKKLAVQLPAHSFVEAVHGFGTIGFAQIVGEAGDLANYANPAKLWKRFGLGLVGDQRQRKTTDAALAIEMGYNPKRRSVMFVIGDSLLKQSGPYKDLYNARKQWETDKATAAGKIVLPAAKINKKNAATSMSMGHVHLRAKRYVEKRVLRDLWRVWVGQVGDVTP